MNRIESLVFAVIGVVLLCGIGIALGNRSLAGAGWMTLASIVFIGIGFVYKARKRRGKRP